MLMVNKVVQNVRNRYYSSFRSSVCFSIELRTFQDATLYKINENSRKCSIYDQTIFPGETRLHALTGDMHLNLPKIQAFM